MIVQRFCRGGADRMKSLSVTGLRPARVLRKLTREANAQNSVFHAAGCAFSISTAGSPCCRNLSCHSPSRARCRDLVATLAGQQVFGATTLERESMRERRTRCQPVHSFATHVHASAKCPGESGHRVQFKVSAQKGAGDALLPHAACRPKYSDCGAQFMTPWRVDEINIERAGDE